MQNKRCVHSAEEHTTGRGGFFGRKFGILLKKQRKKDDKNAKTIRKRKSMLKNDGRQDDGQYLTRGHDERKDERTELLYGDEDEYLADGAGY